MDGPQAAARNLAGLGALVAVSGQAVLATVVWLALAFLGLMALAVRLLRRRPAP